MSPPADCPPKPLALQSPASEATICERWQALSELPLERVTLGEVNADHEFGPDVQVEVLSRFDEPDGPRVAAWETYFDHIAEGNSANTASGT